MHIVSFSKRLLGTRKAFVVLVILNILMTLVIMWSTRNVVLSDTWSYLGLAEGILHGEYSMWWWLDGDYPDTFRNPGYPLFLAGVILVFGSWKAMIGVQFVLYWLAFYLTLRTIARFDSGWTSRNLFMVLFLPMVNVPYYITQVYTEVSALFGISLFLFLVLRPGRWPFRVSILLGVLIGFVVQCKPVFLLFPLLYSIFAISFDRKQFDLKGHLVFLLVFIVTILPFGFWNLKHHGVFRLTTIQGGGGYMHFAYWCGKMPAYTDHLSMRNFTGDELIRFTPPDSVPGHIADFEKEWGGVLDELRPLLTEKDSVMLRSRHLLPYPAENTFNSNYAMLQEKLLVKKGLDHMWKDPWYTVAYKSYTAVRLWVIGIQRGDFQRASLPARFQMLYATTVTGVTFLMAIVLLPLAYRRKVIHLRATWPFLLCLVYVGLIHVPFTIQARYTTCVRFAMFAIIALAISGLWRADEEKGGVDRK